MSANPQQILSEEWPSPPSLKGTGLLSLLSNLGGPGWVIAFAVGLLASIAGAYYAVADMAEPLRSLVVGLSGIVGLLSVSYFFVQLPTGNRIRAQARVAGIRAAVGDLAQPYAITDAAGKIVWVNRAGAALLGTAGGDDRAIAPKQSGESADSVEGLSRACLDRGASQGTLIFDAAGGGARYCEASLTVLAREPATLLWQIVDVTELADLRARAQTATRDLAGYLDSGGIGFFVAGPEGGFKFVNKTLAQWIGRDPDRVVSDGIGFGDIFDQGGREGDGAPVRGMRLKGANGDTIPVRVTSQISGLSGTDTRETYALVQDLRKEERFQDALGEATGRIEQFLNDAPLSIALVHKSGAITGANARFKTLLGDDAEDHQGRLFTDLVHEHDRHEVQDYLEHVLNGHGKTKRVDLRLGQDGAKSATLYASRVTQEDETPGLILYLVDTTDQRNLELQFAQSQKMQAVGQLAGGVAHDFNNLLTAIIGFCDLLLTKHKAGDPSYADVMQIKQNANRAANLTRQLLAFSRRQTLRPKVIAVTDVLAELSNLLRRLLGENIELKMRHGRDIGAIRVDQGQFEQVITNLAVNARDAMPEGGVLTIRTANFGPDEVAELGNALMPPDDYVLIEVADAGVGIPSEILGKIFEPFYTTKGVGEGTGLGLSTVYGIIKQTGGFIFVDSRPGEGTTFNIYLPVHTQVEADEADEVAEAAAQPSQDLTGMGTILLVEDEDAVRTFAVRALRNKGYTVLEAVNGEAALEQLRGHDGKIDLLLSDVVMPQMDGPTLANIALEERADLKIIFISGYAEDAFRDKVGAEDIAFLPKPFSLTQLAARVKEVLQG